MIAIAWIAVRASRGAFSPAYFTPVDLVELYWHLVPDEELFWKLPAADPDVNSLGFLGAEPGPKLEGARRLLFLGDSCTQQEYPNAYPEILGRLLDGRDGPRIDVVNLSMAGYSSHQGLATARRFARRLEPDLAFAWFGWNDHWLAYGAIDSQKSGALRGERMYRESRLLQALRKLLVEWRHLSGTREPLETVRVPLPEFSSNLHALVQHFRELGVPLVLVTAPSAHGELGVPRYLVEQHFAEDERAVLELHRDYVEAVRAVAQAEGAPILDLARELETRGDLAELFARDGIHLSQRGRDVVAERVLEFLEQESLLP